ncbi:MAG TPA: bifunctional acetate--CoA ligase family protein/GNAT family N-acetyltransferase [Devosiaceae bacterium]|jgi:acetyltransferase|nr:bifunctional acetate--CoA ligase family protein/GNAT family N-acetyltransferase [Devosiaceae bacterium]
MSIRNLEAAFAPKSLALVGASEREGSVGTVILRNILDGGYDGAFYPVNPKYEELAGRRCYPSVRELPEPPDLCVIVTPPHTVPDLVGDIGSRGGKSAVVITAGIGDEEDLRERMLAAARPHLLRIIGPNTIGMLAPRLSLNASFTHVAARPGSLALVSQSGAIVSSIIDWAVAEDVGFSQVLSLGDMADVDVGDCLNMLAADPKTSAVLMYLEAIPHGRKFMSAARSAARVKPVILVKPGKHEATARAAQTHTGALAGADAVVDAALRRAGIIRVDDLEDLFSAAEITARFRPLQRGRVAIVTNGGGAGVLAVDHILDRHCTMAQLADETIAALDRVLPPTWSRANPIDIIGDAPPERYRAAVLAAAEDPGVDAILVMNCPTALASPKAAAEAVASLATHGLVNRKPVLATWLGAFAAREARDILNAAGIASLDTPTRAADAIRLLTQWAQLQAKLQRVPESHGKLRVDPDAARQIMERAGAEGRSMLTEPEAKGVLAAYGVAVPGARTVDSVAGVAAAAADILSSSRQVAVKLLSRSITHKSDIGGVVLGLGSPEAAQAAAQQIHDRVAATGQEAAIDGFSVQEMVRRPRAQDLIIGVSSDPVFGPVLMFGSGGVAVEVVRDTTMELLPVDDVLAADMIDRTRVGALLAGYRDRPPADRAAIVAALKAVSQLLIDFPAITAIDINPLLADTDGVVALDARIEIDSSRLAVPGPNPAMAILPYPSGWERLLEVGGQAFRIRPIRPVDAELYPQFLKRITPEDMRRRFLIPTRNLSADLIVRLTQLDYDRDIAFIALAEPEGELAGIVRYSADPDHVRAEFGILVRSDLQGIGLGSGLMRCLIDYARQNQVAVLEGQVLRDNSAMLSLCRELGFTITSDPEQPTVMLVRLPLTA